MARSEERDGDTDGGDAGEARARERRREALGALAEQRAGTGQDGPISATPGARGRRFAAPRRGHAPGRGRFLLGGLAVALAIAVVAVALLHALGRGIFPDGRGRVQPRPIIPALDQLRCEKDVAWSPDGKRIAIVGYRAACPLDASNSYAYWPGLVNVYDGASGKLLRQIQPDQVIATALGLRPPDGATPFPTIPRGDTSAQVVEYTHIQRSPDGAAVALSFAVRVAAGRAPAGGPRVTTMIGLLLVGVDDDANHVLAHVVQPGEDSWGEWDLTDGAFVPAPPSASAPDDTASWFMSPTLRAPALGYRWGAAGALVPVPGLSSAATVPDLGPIGNPDGGASFTVWQPGFVDLRTSVGVSTRSDIPGAQEFSTGFLAWSPDGRYVLDAAVGNWQLWAAGIASPAPEALRDFGLAGTPALPARDAGLAALLRSMPPNQPHLDTTDAAVVAWSPDGRRLAVLRTPNPPATPSAEPYRVTIYDCATGRALGQVTPQLAATMTEGDTGTLLRWSPDSARLLIFNGELGVITIAGPDQLPRA